MKILKEWKVVAIAFALGVVLGTQTWAQDLPVRERTQTGKPNFDKIVPEDVYGYFSVEDMTQYDQVIKKSCFYELWNDPEVQKFVDKAFELIQKEFAKGVTKPTGITIKDITSLGEVFKGQIAFIFDSVELKPFKKKTKRMMRDKETGQPIFDENGNIKMEEVEIESVQPVFHLLLLARVTQNKEKLENLIEKICQSLAEQEIYKQLQEYRDVSYFTFYKKKESLGFSYGYMDDIFFVAYGEKGLKRVIDNYKGGAMMPLNGHSAYKKLLTEIGPKRLNTFFINCVPIAAVLKRVLVAAMPVPEAAEKASETFEKVISLSGLGDLRALVGASRQEGDGLLSISFVHVPGAKRGIWKLLASSATTEFKTIKTAPKNSMVYMSVGLSLTELWDEVMNALSQAMPKEMYDQMVVAGLDGIQQEIGLKIKEDILPVIGKEFTVLEDFNPDFDPTNPLGGMMPMKIGVVFTIADEAKFKQVYSHFMDKIAEEAGEEALPVERKYDGFTFHIVEMPAPGEEEPIEMMGYFFTKELFAFAFPGGYLKEMADAISGKNKGPLSADPDFTQLVARAKTEGKKTYVAYVDYNRFIEFYYQMIMTFTTFVEREVGAPPGEEPPAPEEPKDEKEELIKLIPKLETLKKYLSRCKVYSEIYPTPDGMMSKSFIRIITK